MTNIPRYLLLAGDQYYPAVWDDFVGFYDNPVEADSIGRRLTSKINGYRVRDWYSVIDLENEYLAFELKGAYDDTLPIDENRPETQG